ncbi:MAG: SPOR domain-containing protein [Pseudomonadota bacterium]
MAAQGNRSKGKQEGAPGWAWLVVGLLVGLFIAFLMGLQGEREESDPAQERAESRGPDPLEEERGEPHFDFYSILPEMEVPVPEPEVEDEVRLERERRERESETEQDEREMEPDTAYALQMGSFRRIEEAESYRAELTMLGLEPHIQTVTIDNEDWYRVRIGPIRELDELEQVRGRLEENEIDAILLKLRDQG